MHTRAFRSPLGSFLLLGPRGTGKSTLLRDRHADALWIDLLDPAEQRRFLARPEHLAERVAGHPEARSVVIDEVQKVPALLDVVHALVERPGAPRFILTGSSARKLRAGGVDLLAGRAVIAALHPFLASELGEAFDLAAALRLGLVPIVVDSPEPERVLRTYVALYVREEVQQERLVRSVGDFARFLEVVSLSHAASLNVSAAARECAVPRKTVEGYVTILEDLLLAFQVPVFTRRARRATAARPKFFLFDAGVYRSLRPAGPLDAPSEIDGAALEGLVAQHLRAWLDYAESPARLHHWRTQGGSEVDFVVYGPGVFEAIEVRNTATVRGADLRGLRAFGEDYPEARRTLLYRGEHAFVRDGVRVLPVETYLSEIAADVPLP